MPINYNNEQALRYVVIMAYLSAVDHYLRFEELASGKGYSDILFLPRNTFFEAGTSNRIKME